MKRVAEQPLSEPTWSSRHPIRTGSSARRLSLRWCRLERRTNWQGRHDVRFMGCLAAALAILVLAVHLPAGLLDRGPGWEARQATDRVLIHDVERIEVILRPRTVPPEPIAPLADAVSRDPSSSPAAEPAYSSHAQERLVRETRESRGDSPRTPAPPRPRLLSAAMLRPAPPAGAEVAARSYAALAPVLQLDPLEADPGYRRRPRLRTESLDIGYPEDARAGRIEGRVILSFEVGIDGRARNIRIIESLHPSCDDEAVRAVEKARFSPGTHGEEPVAAEARLAIRFILG